MYKAVIDEVDWHLAISRTKCYIERHRLIAVMLTTPSGHKKKIVLDFNTVTKTQLRPLISIVIYL